jgi:hypothetical protein
VLCVAIGIVVAFASPAGKFGGASAERPATQDYLNQTAPAPQRAAESATSGDYAYLLTSKEHEYPARWCAGSDIGYTIDFSQALAVGLDPQEERTRWAEVFAEWTQASRGQYSFHYAGQNELGTTVSDGSREIDIDAIDSQSIGITYVYGDDDDANGDDYYLASAVKGRTAGNGGLQVVSKGTNDASALVGDRGFVMIDAADVVGLAPSGLRRTLYLHESGHSLGLGHVQQTKSLMHGTLSQTRLNLANGDITGINELAAMPCDG